MANAVLKIINDRLLDKIKNGESKGILIKDYVKVSQGGKDFYLNEPRNYETDRCYSGINKAILPAGYYLTLNQIQKLGGHLNKGAKAIKVLMDKPLAVVHYSVRIDGQLVDKYVSAKSFEKLEKGKDYEEKLGEFIRHYFSYYKVFNINDTTGVKEIKHEDLCENIVSPIPPTNELDSISELIIQSYKKSTGLLHHSGNTQMPFYTTKDDSINIPDYDTFANSSKYYETVFHEIAHSTGNEKRLNRKTLAASDGFGGDRYCEEELIAETTSIYMLQKLHLMTNELLDECSDYIKSWYDHLKDKPEGLLVSVFSNADKALNYILNEAEKSLPKGGK